MQQGEGVGLLEGDDEEEQPGDEGHDQRVEQEDHLERLAHLGDARGLVGGLVAGQCVGVRVGVVHRRGELFG